MCVDTDVARLDVGRRDHGDPGRHRAAAAHGAVDDRTRCTGADARGGDRTSDGRGDDSATGLDVVDDDVIAAGDLDGGDDDVVR
jgi:hypothetical protein